MTLPSKPPTEGAIAFLRQRHYLVEGVQKPKRNRDATLVRLSCVDDDNQGQPLEVLWEKELNPHVVCGEDWERIAAQGFDEQQLFAAYVNTLKWNCVTSTDPKLFQAPFRAGIRLDAYQLEPLRKALLLPRVNLFIADDVGLGKTIEAGLIARELLLRKKVTDIVVSCPPSMLLQWQEELEARFGLLFEILDRDYIRRVRRERGFGVNPWSTHSRFLVSHRLLIDEAYSGPLRDHLGSFRGGSLLILDEAHHAAPSSGQKYAVDSKITRAVEDLAKRFEHRLFLSATPHNGHSNSFSRLLELLDPQRFCRGVPVEPEHRDAVIVRRLKEDLREVQGGFPKRKVVQVVIDGLPADAPELKLSQLLDDYRTTREQRLEKESKRTQAASALLIIGLQQRLLSSIEAFAKTLRVHRRTVEKQRRKVLENAAESAPVPDSKSLDLLTQGVNNDDDRAAIDEAQLELEVESQIESASAATIGSTDGVEAECLFAREQELLSEMEAIAEEARYEPDGRTKKLVDWIKEHMCPDLGKDGAQWNDTRVILFTEYDDTKRYLVQVLEAMMAGTDRGSQRIQIFHGPTPISKREEIKRAFNTPPSQHPVRILVATDAAREGLNLQAYCSNLFHFDVPWNPSRMEQRNGRIDRKLQPSEEVQCHYFVYAQRPEDRILKKLVEKTETIKQELGSLSQVIDASLARTMSAGIKRSDINQMESDIDKANLDDTHRAAMEEELEGARKRQQDLRQQIERLRTNLKDSRQTIGLNDEQFRSAVSCSLQLMGAERLGEAGEIGNNVEKFTFPAIHQRDGADPTWMETMDTLREPRKRDQKLWDWRREAPVREVVFADPGVVTNDVVHLHLEQRVVQRLLGRFSAQGFVHHDLSRACFAQVKDAIPRVILLGRLCLYGQGAARLHEQLIPVSARWQDPKIRAEPLKPYAKTEEAETLALLDSSLLKPQGVQPESAVIEQLKNSAAQDVNELEPLLQQRGEEFARDAIEKLTARGQTESEAMLEILQRQRNHIKSTIKKMDKFDKQQLKFEFAQEEELAQLDANKRFWARRLEELKEEIKSEPERIQDLYEVHARRIEPIGLVYLWPVTG